MDITAIVGEPKHRYEAEKNFTTGPGVEAIKSYDTYRSLVADIKRDEHFFKNIIVCLPNGDFKTVQAELRKLVPKARITPYHA